MDVESRIKALMNEAEIYQVQGLLDEAKEKYDDASALIRMSDDLEDRQTWLNTVSEKISALGSDFAKVKKAPRQPELSSKVQDLIKDLFSFSAEEDKDASELEGAMVLAKFGQFERALTEFNKLIEKEEFRVVAAKNILRCYVANDALHAAVSQYEEWVTGDIVFTSQQFESIRIFLQNILDRKKIDKRLSTVVAPADAETVVKSLEVGEPEISEEEEFLDITCVGVTFERGPHKGRMMEFDVNFQRGNVVSFIASGKDKDLISSLEVGSKVSELECSSAFAVFMASGLVTEKMRIDSGSRRGDYRVDIKIEST
jgi:tetratricopeptide (TPR) repeat protein